MPMDKTRDPQALTERLDGPMAALGLMFLLVVVGEGLAQPGSALHTTFVAAGWVIWVAFVAEYALKLIWAPDRGEFLRKSWWQLIFLALPFLRLLRVARVLRTARAGRVVSSVVRASRSARGALTARVSWLAAVTAIVILGSSQLLFEFSDIDNYATALHAAAYAAFTGEPIRDPSGFARFLELLLAAYSVVVFAALAGSVGAFFLERTREEEAVALPPATGEGDNSV